MSVVRRAVPLLFLPLCLVASVFAAAPWLRSFPLSVAGAPLYGAALLSVLVPLLTARIRPSLWLGIVVDLVVFILYSLGVVLQSATDLTGVVQGIYRGPSQLLTFALPLVSPRSLLIAPVALVWLAGALAGECVARRWYTMLPYVGFLVAFALAYAATQRAAGSDLAAARSRETLLAAGLLVTLLLMRMAQAWVNQDESAEMTEPDGVMPLRGLVVGTVTTLVVVLIASLVVQTDAFPKRANTPQRVPTVNDSNPLTPLSFVAGLRPSTAKSAAQPVFTVGVNKPSSGYFAIANVDLYDGSGWSFDRTFRPSGGVLPADIDTSLRSTDSITQQYRIDAGPLTAAPWMPFLYRAQDVTGTSVNIDPSSGMIVPAGRLRSGTTYTVQSGVAARTFGQLRVATATPDTATSTVDTQLPGGLRSTLDRLIASFATEIGVSSTPGLPFLKALLTDLRSQYSLSSAARGSSTGSPTASPSPTPSGNSAAAELAGGTGFADVLASIRGTNRSGTPEQFATLVALIARELGIPARIVTGFKVAPKAGASQLAAGQYNVTTADAWTWVEVPIAGQGWVVLDGSPSRFSSGRQPTASGAAPSSSSAPPSQNALITQGPNGHAVAPKSGVPATSSVPKHALLVVLFVAVGLLLVLLLLILLSRKRIRAGRRRRSPDPRTRLIGAWQESLDVLAEAGLPELTTFTSAEIAELTGEQFGAESGERTAALGSAANSVAYSATTVIDAAAADAAWAQQRTLRKLVRHQLGVRGRIAASVRYHRPKNSVRPTSPTSWAAAAAAQRKAAISAAAASRRYRGRRRAH